ncbi:MAG TPA: regulatory protein RecX [Bacteroidales bacterium]|nr:regulatory protein RecX [Bacteroidales bacterium]
MVPDIKSIAIRIRKFCTYRERSLKETEAKLAELGCPSAKIPALIRQLETEDFLNGPRYASAYARGKFHINRWGKRKIAYALKRQGVPEALIRQALEEIPEAEYREGLKKLLVGKIAQIKPGKNLKKREKVINFALGRGFEASLANEILKELNA